MTKRDNEQWHAGRDERRQARTTTPAASAIAIGSRARVLRRSGRGTPQEGGVGTRALGSGNTRVARAPMRCPGSRGTNGTKPGGAKPAGPWACQRDGHRGSFVDHELRAKKRRRPATSSNESGAIIQRTPSAAQEGSSRGAAHALPPAAITPDECGCDTREHQDEACRSGG